jgi:hypothetical protein
MTCASSHDRGQRALNADGHVGRVEELVGVAAHQVGQLAHGRITFTIQQLGEERLQTAGVREGGEEVRVRVGVVDERVRHAGPFVMRGRELSGWLRVEDASDLRPWVEIGVAYARSLPAK